MDSIDNAGITRRGTLATMVAGTALAAMPDLATGAPANGSPFLHGVASGDPDQESVVLWTRVSVDAPTLVQWELASDPGFAQIVRSGSVEATAETDYTVKVLVGGLPSGGRFHYRFRARGVQSPAGRTRTLAAGKLDKLGIALVSCSNFAFGFFNAYDAIARDPTVDFVLHTGDYIYEYGADEWGSATAHRIGRVHEPANEIVSLADYRRRHAQYKTDAGAQAMHAAHPLLACWDDHESTNNPWTGGAQNHQPDREGDWALRRAASIRAYYEWMPIREPVPGRERIQFWRGYSFGDLATLFTLETRHTGRARQIDYMDGLSRIHTREDARKFERETIDAPGRALLSPVLEQDLGAALKRSVGAGQPWRIIGNPMVIARVRVPDVVAAGLIPDPAGQAGTAGKGASDEGTSDEARALAWKGKFDMPFYPDTWDGYEWARERLYGLSRDAGAGDLVFLTGDSHSFWANTLRDAAGKPAGVELGTAGVTSPGDFVESGFGPTVSPLLDKALADHNPEVVWTDNMHQGYVRVEFTRAAAQATFVAVDTVLSPAYRAAIIKRFAIAREGGALNIAEATAVTKT